MSGEEYVVLATMMCVEMAEDLHPFRADDNRARIPGIDKEFQFLNPVVDRNELQANPRSCGLAFVDIPLFRSWGWHGSYNRMKTSSG